MRAEQRESWADAICWNNRIGRHPGKRTETHWARAALGRRPTRGVGVGNTRLALVGLLVDRLLFDG